MKGGLLQEVPMLGVGNENVHFVGIIKRGDIILEDDGAELLRVKKGILIFKKGVISLNGVGRDFDAWLRVEHGMSRVKNLLESGRNIERQSQGRCCSRPHIRSSKVVSMVQP